MKGWTNISFVFEISPEQKLWSFMVVNHYLVNYTFKFYEDPCTNVCARAVDARTPDKTCACMFTTRARTFVHWLSWNLKLELSRQWLTTTFHEHPSFCCGDICKTKLTLVRPFIFYEFCIFSKLDLWNALAFAQIMIWLLTFFITLLQNLPIYRWQKGLDKN